MNSVSTPFEVIVRVYVEYAVSFCEPDKRLKSIIYPSNSFIVCSYLPRSACDDKHWLTVLWHSCVEFREVTVFGFFVECVRVFLLALSCLFTRHIRFASHLLQLDTSYIDFLCLDAFWFFSVHVLVEFLALLDFLFRWVCDSRFISSGVSPPNIRPTGLHLLILLVQSMFLLRVPLLLSSHNIVANLVLFRIDSCACRVSCCWSVFLYDEFSLTTLASSGSPNTVGDMTVAFVPRLFV